MIGIEKQFFWLECITSAAAMKGSCLDKDQIDKIRLQLREFTPGEFRKFRAKCAKDSFIQSAYRHMTGRHFVVSTPE